MSTPRKFATFRDVLYSYSRNLDEITRCRKEIDRCHAENRELYDTIVRVLRREGCALEHCGYYYQIGSDGDLVVMPIKSAYSIDMNDSAVIAAAAIKEEKIDPIAASMISNHDMESPC